MRKIVLAALLALLLAAPARAGYTAHFDGVGKGIGSFTYTFKTPSGTYKTQTSFAGELRYTFSDPLPPSSNLFTDQEYQTKGQTGWDQGELVTFCVDLGHWVQSNTTGLSEQSLTTIVSTTTASWIAELYDQYLKLGTHTNLLAAQYQAAFWELVYDNGNVDLSSGNFKFSDNNGVTRSAVKALIDSVKNSPQEYTGVFYDPGNRSNTNANDGGQGFLGPATPVPGPSGIVLSLMGISTLVLSRWRIRRQSDENSPEQMR